MTAFPQEAQCGCASPLEQAGVCNTDMCNLSTLNDSRNTPTHETAVQYPYCSRWSAGYGSCTHLLLSAACTVMHCSAPSATSNRRGIRLIYRNLRLCVSKDPAFCATSLPGAGKL